MSAVRVVLQRVETASVAVGGATFARIGRGLLALVGVTDGDTADDAVRLATKTAALRIFGDGDRPFHRSVGDIGGEILVVSQFTLYGDVRRGNRPSWTEAASPEIAEPLVRRYGDALAAGGLVVERGEFGANMQVRLLNDGPVTLVIDTERLARPRGS